MTLRTASAAIFVSLLVAGCMSTPVTVDNPFKTPNRGYGSGLTPEQAAELVDQMQPCVDFARETFPQVADRFLRNPVKGARFYVVTRAEGPIKQFYVHVEDFKDGQIHGRVDSGIQAHGRSYARGDRYSLPVSEVVDWLIYYRDRPEEGNLLGKYLLRRKDGLISGSCEPNHSELTSFRVYRAGYSFIPPEVQHWRVYGANKELGTDFGMQKSNAETGTLDTIYAIRSQLPQSLDQTKFAGYVKSVEKDNLGDPNRYQLLAHEVTSIPHGEEACVLSQQLIKDNSALLKSGERTPMTREIRSLVCMHPDYKDISVTLTYAHRYSEGQRDPTFVQESERMFRSLSFYER